MTLTLGRRHALAAAGALVFSVAFGSGLLSWLAMRTLPETVLAWVTPWLPEGRGFGASDPYVRQNIDALAVRLGELQARLARLDAIGQRVAEKAGIRSTDLPGTPGRGGPLSPGAGSMSMSDLDRALESASGIADQRHSQLLQLEDELLMRNITARLLPTAAPLSAGTPGSGFGWRIDPFTGHHAMHEGVDFNAPVGTPIVAAGGGKVVAAGWHPTYGLHVDVDHGEGVVTRYAHASKLHVQVGDIVRQGQRLAAVGSTGRSTGSHLHFEVRVNDVAQDPRTFLAESGALKRPRGRAAMAASGERDAAGATR